MSAKSWLYRTAWEDVLVACGGDDEWVGELVDTKVDGVAAIEGRRIKRWLMVCKGRRICKPILTIGREERTIVSWSVGPASEGNCQGMVAGRGQGVHDHGRRCVSQVDSYGMVMLARMYWLFVRGSKSTAPQLDRTRVFPKVTIQATGCKGFRRGKLSPGELLGVTIALRGVVVVCIVDKPLSKSTPI